MSQPLAKRTYEVTVPVDQPQRFYDAMVEKYWPTPPRFWGVLAASIDGNKVKLLMRFIGRGGWQSDILRFVDDRAQRAGVRVTGRLTIDRHARPVVCVDTYDLHAGAWERRLREEEAERARQPAMPF